MYFNTKQRYNHTATSNKWKPDKQRFSYKRKYQPKLFKQTAITLSNFTISRFTRML